MSAEPEGAIEWSPKQAEVLDYVRDLPTSVPHSDPSAVAEAYMLLTNIRVERVQSISQEDAMAEGIIPDNFSPDGWNNARGMFEELWTKINGKKHPWESNPFVWVIDFRKVTS